jgi:hypothetical protein
VPVNQMGTMGIALWLNGDAVAAPSRHGFLEGWLGGRVFMLKRESNAVQTVWLSLWERPGMVRAFCRKTGRRLRDSLGGVPYAVERESGIVAAVWGSGGGGRLGVLRAAGGACLVDAESNPDRHCYGAFWGLFRRVGDVISGFTHWSVPLLASWHRHGERADERFCWDLLRGLLADGTERRARSLFVPVWRGE